MRARHTDEPHHRRPRAVRAASRRSWGRGTTRPAGARAIAMVALVLGLLSPGVGTVGAQSTTPSPSPALGESGTIGRGPRLELIDQDNWIGPRGTFRMVLGVVVPDPEYSLQARLFPAVASAEAVLGNEGLPPKVRPLDRFANLTLPAGTTTQRLELTVVPEADGTFGDPYVLDPGVYPIEVRLFDPDGEIVGSLITYLVHLPQSLLVEPIPVAVISDLRVPPERTSSGGVQLSAETATRLQRQLDGLNRFGDVPVTVQVHPETVGALVESRTGNGGAPLSEILRLTGSGGTAEVLGGTYVGFDEAAWVGDQQHDRLQRELAAGSGSLDNAQLRHRRDTAALVGPTEAVVLSHLAQLGISRVVSNPGGTHAGTGIGFGPGPAVLPERPDQSVLAAPVLQLDDRGPERTGAPGVLDAHRLLTALVVGAIGGDHRSRQVRLGRDVDLGGSFVSTLLGALATPGPLEPVTVGGLFDDRASYGPPAAAPIAPGAPGGSVPRSDELAATSTRVEGLRTLLGEDRTADSLQAELLLVPSKDLSEQDAQALIDDVETKLRSITDNVALPDSQAFTTTSHETALPLVVRNGYTQPLRVLLTLDSGELEFTGPNPMAVTLQPGPNDLEVPIKTRRSGEFDFDIQVTSPDGAITLGDIDVRVQSRAISGAGLLLSISALLFLVVWWLRNAHRRRRRPPAPHDDIAASPTLTDDEGFPVSDGAASSRTLDDAHLHDEAQSGPDAVATADQSGRSSP